MTSTINMIIIYAYNMLSTINMTSTLIAISFSDIFEVRVETAGSKEDLCILLTSYSLY